MPGQSPFFEPLSARDAWFLYAERPETPLDVGTVYIFEGESQVPGGRGAQGVEDTIRERLHLVPRYRQRIQRVPLNLAHPVWVDDPNFDLGAHVRREVLPPPGDGASLRKLVMRILARPLDISTGKNVYGTRFTGNNGVDFGSHGEQIQTGFDIGDSRGE